tara:strand:- start:193 stop:468 length:276 start_codon:yes stop_codon:yes gene_type:complete
VLSSSVLFVTLYAYISDPRAIEVEANIPKMSIKAKRPPIKPPFNLSKLDFIRSISRKNVVAFKEVILIKARGAKGFNNIQIFLLPTLKRNS